jgi:(E)-4-hydroxy-3-methylbut-2-enyl-diphosphate synthase
MTPREKTKAVRVGGLTIGGGSPVAVQSMTNTDTRDVAATVKQIHALQEAGCELVRVAVPDGLAADAVKQIKKEIAIPLVADVHFDYRLAVKAIHNGADKLRINPGNIGGPDRVRQVAREAKAAGVPIRVGVNGGSLEKEILAKHGGVTPAALAESALRHIKLLEDNDFTDIVVSVKVSDVPRLVEVHKLLAEQIPYPIHLGLTEAGTPYRGSLRSAVGIGAVLLAGIGDTIRVSLTGDPTEEVRCAKEILQATGLRRFGPRFISCPTCGRTEIDLAKLATEIEALCENLDKPITVAIMGCVVNGPGEAREADVGIAGGKGVGVIFKKGQRLRTVPEDEIKEAILNEINLL